MARTTLAFSLLLLSTPSFATSPTWDAWKTAKDPEAFPVAEYLELGAEGADEIVVLAAGTDQGLRAGMTFKTYRKDRDLWVETGRLKARDVQPNATIAVVESHGSALAKALFPKFPNVMAGDLAVAQRVTLARRPVVTPTVDMSYYELFEDPKSQPSSYELKREALARIKDAVKPFATARVGMLMVEGYTDHHGSSQANQVESYQRALTVRQYLIDELGFEPHRVVAVGYGEGELSDATMAPGHVEANRRIVLKAVANQ